MTREEFDHAIRSAGKVMGVDEVIVVGSQALYGSMSTIPGHALYSMEADIGALNDPDEFLADMIDGTLGERTQFHDMYGFYVDGITTNTPKAPPDWMDRLVRYESPSTNGVVAWCIDPHDLWIAKAIAHRDKDTEFCRALAEYGTISKAKTLGLLNTMTLSDGRVERAIELFKNTYWTTA